MLKCQVQDILESVLALDTFQLGYGLDSLQRISIQQQMDQIFHSTLAKLHLILFRYRCGSFSSRVDGGFSISILNVSLPCFSNISLVKSFPMLFRTWYDEKSVPIKVER